MTTSNLTGTLSVQSQWKHSGTAAPNFGTPIDSGEVKPDVTYTYGTTNSATVDGKRITISSGIQELYRETRTVTPSTTADDIDLTSLTTFDGTSISLATIKELYIFNRSTNPGNDIIVGDAASNPWSAPWDGDTDGKNTVRACGMLLITAPLDGLAVSGTSKVLRVTWDAGTNAEDIEYDIVLKGTI